MLQVILTGLAMMIVVEHRVHRLVMSLGLHKILMVLDVLFRVLLIGVAVVEWLPMVTRCPLWLLLLGIPKGGGFGTLGVGR